MCNDLTPARTPAQEMGKGDKIYFFVTPMIPSSFYKDGGDKNIKDQNGRNLRIRQEQCKVPDSLPYKDFVNLLYLYKDKFYETIESSFIKTYNFIKTIFIILFHFCFTYNPYSLYFQAK